VPLQDQVRREVRHLGVAAPDVVAQDTIRQIGLEVGRAAVIPQNVARLRPIQVSDHVLEIRGGQRTGDEVLIVAPSADDLLSTAIALIHNTSTENEFLQVHGGLHYGKVLKRNDHYFGNTINLASRIASKAAPGTVWCSDDFIKALALRESRIFEARGEHDFKNLRDRSTIFELLITRDENLYIDPVCKMQIRDKINAFPHPTHTGIYFCSEACLNIYLAE